MSSIDTNGSNSKGKSTINKITEKFAGNASGLGITDKYLSERKVKQEVDK